MRVLAKDWTSLKAYLGIVSVELSPGHRLATEQGEPSGTLM